MAGMSSGPHNQHPSDAVYKRRRMVVGVAVLVVLILIIWGIVAGVRALGGHKDGANAAGTAAPSPTAGADNTASGSASPDASSTEASTSPAGVNPDGTCPQGAVSVKASTDKKTYAVGQKPVLILTLRNTLSEACTADVGTKAQVFTVTSGSDRIFSTSDCQKDAASTELKLEPGQDETARFTWDRTRSLPQCAAIATKPRAGTYTLKVKLGKTESAPVQFVLQ